MIIFLNPSKTTAKQASAIIRRAIRAKRKQENREFTQEDFCKASGLSRVSIAKYHSGERAPGPEGVMKIAAGLKAWGIEARIDV